MIKGSHGDLLQKCLDGFLRKDPQYEADRATLVQELVKDYNLAFAKLTIIQYFNLHNVPGRQAYATIDVVEKVDAQRRMPFLNKPRGNYADPDGLLQAWVDRLYFLQITLTPKLSLTIMPPS